MVDILHRVGIVAKPDAVFAALTTLEGVRVCWVSTATGDAGPGGTIDFGFCRMKVVATEPGRLVRWPCTSGPDEALQHQVGDASLQSRRVRRTGERPARPSRSRDPRRRLTTPRNASTQQSSPASITNR